jgi:hypothetical protein
MSTALRRQVVIPNICDTGCLKKFEDLISQKFKLQKDTTLPAHIKFKAKLHKIGLAKEVHIEVYTNDNVDIKTSPGMQHVFNAICAEIEYILKEASTKLCTQDVVRVNRAKKILTFTQGLAINDEIGRMAIVVLCDIILDLMVTEKLSQFTGTRQDLENESVGAKISLLENRYQITLYRQKSIRDVRELRNKIAHGGAPTSEDDAIFARDAACDIFALL